MDILACADNADKLQEGNSTFSADSGVNKSHL